MSTIFYFYEIKSIMIFAKYELIIVDIFCGAY